MQRVILSCSCCFIDTVTEVWVAVKWWNLLWKLSTFSLTFTHATGPSHFVNAMQGHRSLWVITTVHKFRIHSVHPSLLTKWHDRHRYLSIHHVPYLMSLNSPRHGSKTWTMLITAPAVMCFIKCAEIIIAFSCCIDLTDTRKHSR